MIGRFVILMAILVAWQHCGVVYSADTNTVVLPETVKTMDALDDHRKLGLGDRVTYRVIEDEDEPRSLTVTDSGDLEVPYYGLVHAAGKTSRELARETKALLERQLYYQATVIIAIEVVNKTHVTGKVYVTGQVRNSGGFEIPGGETLTVSRAILNAGGFSDFSDKKNVRLIRKTANGTKTFVVNILDVWQRGNLDKDLVVQPDDLIVVPARLDHQVLERRTPWTATASITLQWRTCSSPRIGSFQPQGSTAGCTGGGYSSADTGGSSS